MFSPKLHFARFEFKYVLSATLRQELENELVYFLEFDPYVKSRKDHQYFVRSLYFDDPHYSSFFDKVNGLHTRSKFRVRTYTDDPLDGTPQFLEIKGRYNNLVLKHRTPLDAQKRISFEHGDHLTTRVLAGCGGSDIGRKLEYEYFRKQLRPVALVDYVRRPYVSRFDPEFRLTFDSDLRGTKIRSLFSAAATTQPRGLLPGYTVMEVKFRRHIPSWFHRLIQAYELRRVSVSKICYAMEALGIANDPS
ncbi:polyphosphate polymerase domain-containing protein [uncultured Desulfuromonas sp.]|uniref:polyphosphate polymerase domain-containing protein n=1 Tax=uncultured Desulfuromonas sp. TaxID=181013 RepID=UPI002AAB6853|nr:polyphosphate polymerase domain-containing protein [uncultured Desulfuromonas sp.]